MDFNYYIWLVFRFLFILLIFVFLISGIDDLFVDLVYYFRVLFRKLFRRKQVRPLTLEQLNSVPEKPVAIMIPAWDESNVIGKMLINTAGTMNYKNFYLFVGTYPNDEATRLEVERAREIYPNIEVVVTPADGPTNKADCLNWVYQGILVFEKEHDIHFEVFMMHDSEDIIHPLSLKYINFLMPRMHFIQVPVFPLETPWYKMIAGVYKDEFAENHTKDLRARETLAAVLPSAGVGTALSRFAIDYLAQERKNQIFDIHSITEDYLMGLSLKDLPGKKIFLQQFVTRVEKRKSRFTGREYEKKVKEPIATREFFPDTFGAAVHQKSRWILGITLQGWAAGWMDSIGANYCLYRDRKAILTNLAVILGYIIAIYWALTAGANALAPSPVVPSMVQPDEIYFKLLVGVIFILCWRILNRAIAVYRIYGLADALMSVPRLFVGNVLNFASTFMAIRRYIDARISGKTPAWGKTAHAWPSEDQLRKYRLRLGDLLLERRVITTEQLQHALDEQKRSGKKLGEILIEQGVIWEEDLVFALARQDNVQAVEIDPYAHPELLDLVPRSLAERYQVFPIEKTGETLVLAHDAMQPRINKEELSGLLGRPVQIKLTTGADIDFAITRGYAGKETFPLSAAGRLGQRLLNEGRVTHEQLRDALRKQKRTHQKLGEVLVENHVLTEEELVAYLKETAS